MSSDLAHGHALCWHHVVIPRGVTFKAYWRPLLFTRASSWFNVGPGPPDLVPTDVKDTVAVDAAAHPEEGPTIRVAICGD